MFLEISVFIFWLLIIGIIVIITLILFGKIDISNTEFANEVNQPITWVSKTFKNKSLNSTYSYQLINNLVTLKFNNISEDNNGTANDLIIISEPIPIILRPTANVYSPIINVLSNGKPIDGAFIIYPTGIISFGIGYNNTSSIDTNFGLLNYPTGSGGSNNGFPNTTISYMIN